MQFTFSIDLQLERKHLYNEWYDHDEINEKYTLKRFLKLKATQKRIISKYKPIIEPLKPTETTLVYKVLGMESIVNPRVQVSFLKDESINHPLNDYEWINECKTSYNKLNEWNASIEPYQHRKIITKDYDMEFI